MDMDMDMDMDMRQGKKGKNNILNAQYFGKFLPKN